jgi:hypothetical protein
MASDFPSSQNRKLTLPGKSPHLFFLCAVLGLYLRAFTLSHSTSPIFVKGFQDRVLQNYLPGLASNLDPPD